MDGLAGKPAKQYTALLPGVKFMKEVRVEESILCICLLSDE
jgi:hypothetical protein